MKKIVFVLMAALCLSTGFAQTKDANTLKNEGNESFRNKDFKGAYASYSQAIELLKAEGTVDTALIYNTGYCAFKIPDFAAAEPYFLKSVELNYKEDKPYAFLAQIYSKSDDLVKMEAILTKGLEKYPNEAGLNKLAGVCYLKQGLVFYNAGNDIKTAANTSKLNETNPEAFNAEYAKADEQYTKALPLMELSYKYDAQNKNTLKALQNIYTNLDMTDKASAMQAEYDALKN